MTKRPARRAAKKVTGDLRGKRLQFDAETLATLETLAADNMMTFQELADEAFRDLLRKHGQPIDLRDALKKSVQEPHPGRPRSRRS